MFGFPLQCREIIGGALVGGIGVERGVRPDPGPPSVIARGGDHDGVVPAEMQRRDGKDRFPPPADVLYGPPQMGIGRHASRHDQGGRAGLPDGGSQLFRDALGDGPGEGSGDCPADLVRQFVGFPLLLFVVDGVDDGGFQAAEGEIEGIVGNGGRGKAERIDGSLTLQREPLGRQTVHGRAAGVGKSHDPSHLVEGLPAGVVPGSADLREGVPVRHVVQGRVPSGNHQRQIRRLHVRMLHIGRGHVTPDVVHRNQRDPQGGGQGLGEADPHQKGSDQTGGKGHGRRVHVGEGHAGLLHRLSCDARNGLAVGAAGDLRDHAAVEGMDGNLGRDNIGEHLKASVFRADHGGRRFVAGALHGKDDHRFPSDSGTRTRRIRTAFSRGFS